MEKLEIYKKAISLLKKTYQLINDYEVLKKDFSLNDQLKCSSISFVLNIAEDCGRGVKFFTNFLKISTGLANETIAILTIVNEIYKINTLK